MAAAGRGAAGRCAAARSGVRTPRPAATINVRDAASRLDVTPRTLKYYEEFGIVVPARSEGGYHLYEQADLDRLSRVLRMRSLGFSLAAIAAMLQQPMEARGAGLLHRPDAGRLPHADPDRCSTGPARRDAEDLHGDDRLRRCTGADRRSALQVVLARSHFELFTASQALIALTMGRPGGPGLVRPPPVAAPAPLLQLHALRQSAFRVGLVLYVVYYYLSTGFSYLLPRLMEGGLGFTVGNAGYLTGAASLVTGSLVFVYMRYSARLSRKKWLIGAGFGIGALAAWWLAQVTPQAGREALLAPLRSRSQPSRTRSAACWRWWRARWPSGSGSCSAAGRSSRRGSDA
ncbi:MerR family transcriptional regulator [Variovorax sp. JS1663]|uniref:MerR family transcriptional regulator n=1 Tax=Variovorax sp. JS1663 TaxID=1851577 RepID=UPI003FCF0507